MLNLIAHCKQLPSSYINYHSINYATKTFLFALSALVLVTSLIWPKHSMAGEYNYRLEALRTGYMAAQQRFVECIQKPEMNNKGYRRNLMKFLAKAQLAERNLFTTEKNYLAELSAVVSITPRYVDLDYKKNPKLDSAVKEYNLIRQEVGNEIVQEAVRAFPDEEMLNGL